MPTNKKPIYVSNPNDSRIRAYNDSLKLYNSTNAAKKFLNQTSIFDLDKEKQLEKINPYKKNNISSVGSSFYDNKAEIYNYKKPEQPYVYQKVKEEKKKEKKPIITTDRRKVQAYQDSSFIKKNFNIFPKPKGYDQTLKRVGQDPSADYFPAPEQPYILKKEKKKIKKEKKDIVPVPVKESIPKDTIPIIEPVVKPQVEKEPEPIVPKKLPGGSGPFARYPNMKGQLSNVKTSRMVNARKVKNIVPTFVSGAKSVKQYRGDENLPEAKNGMKKCGCKHSKSKYKYQAGGKSIAVDDLELPEGDVPISYNSPVQKVNKTKSSTKKTVDRTPTVPKKSVIPVNQYSDFDEDKITKDRFNYLKGLEEKSRKQDSTYYANNIGRQIEQAAGNNTRVYVTENREGKPLKGKKSGDNTCITGVCNVAKKAGAKIPFNSAIAEDRNSPFDNPIQTRYNPAFRDNAESMGFKLLPQNAKMQRGDIVQLNEKGNPHHAMLYYGDDYKGSIFGNDVGNEDDGRSFFGLGPKKDLGFEKRWMGPFSNRSTSSINPIAKNALAYRYMGVPSKKASMQEAVAYTKAEKAKYLKNQELLAKRNIKKEIPKTNSQQIAFNTAPLSEELTFQKNGNKSIMSNRLNKYKYGTGAITIPEGSAIVTANKGKNKQALMAYKKGNYKLLNNIIDDMPEDNVDKAQAGKKATKVKGKYEKTDANNETFYEESVLGGPERYGKEMSLDKAQNLYNLTDEQFEKAYGKNKKSDTYRIERGRRDAVQEGNVTYTVDGKKGKDGKPLKYASGYRSKPGEGEKPKETPVKLPEKPSDEIPPPTTKTPPDDTGKRKEYVTMPSMAEIAARSSILGQGIEGIPENYLKLGRYNYASQLDRILRENAIAANTAKENIRDVSGGSAGSYLSNVANITGKRFDANAGAVTQDTLARQDILNKNVDLGNTEAQVNTGLKNQYAELRGKARSNYNDQLVALGQRIDSATETAQEMSNQRGADDQRMQVLKDLGLNYEYKNVDGLMKLVPKVPVNTPPTTTGTPDAVSKKGLKKVKTYKRR